MRLIQMWNFKLAEASHQNQLSSSLNYNGKYWKTKIFSIYFYLDFKELTYELYKSLGTVKNQDLYNNKDLIFDKGIYFLCQISNSDNQRIIKTNIEDNLDPSSLAKIHLQKDHIHTQDKIQHNFTLYVKNLSKSYNYNYYFMITTTTTGMNPQIISNSSPNCQLYGFLCQKTNVFYAFQSYETYQQFLQWLQTQPSDTLDSSSQRNTFENVRIVNQEDQLEDYDRATREIMRVFNDPFFLKIQEQVQLQEFDL